jgi:hypothetical protein
MVDEVDGGDLDADRNRERRSSQDLNRAEAASSRADNRLPDDFDVDGYAMMVYRANLNLDTADAQVEYNTTPELRRIRGSGS